MKIGKLVVNNRAALKEVLKAILPPLDTFIILTEETVGAMYFSEDYQIECFKTVDFVEIISYGGYDWDGEKIATAKITIEVDTTTGKTIADDFIDAHIFVSQWKNFFQPVSPETKKLFSAFAANEFIY